MFLVISNVLLLNKDRLDKYHSEQIELITQQEDLVLDLFKIVGHFLSTSFMFICFFILICLRFVPPMRSAASWQLSWLSAAFLQLFDLSLTAVLFCVYFIGLL